MSFEEENTAPLERASVPELDAILGKQFKVLDEGFVRAVDYMGSDLSIVQAARVSYGDGTKKGTDDRHLIRYLMRHRHTTPFEMCEIKFHVRVPMDIWRQWVRHRTANINEYSTRYSIAIDSVRSTDANEWRAQSSTNRQGSGDALNANLGAELTAQEKELHEKCREVYQHRLDAGVAREQARKDLPLATYTEAYWKCDLHNLFHFLSLRMEAAAQYEIREYACTIGNEIVAKWVPHAWGAFTDYLLESQNLSRVETALLGLVARGENEAAMALAAENNMLPKGLPGRELREFEEKLSAFGLASPWTK